MLKMGAEKNLMSGKGSAAWASFNEEALAEKAYNILKKKYKQTYLTKVL
jgi:4-diphosphocytidyl-2C-methyl-D-erythritol kinase